jgi:molybdenum cofactor cytidylyltransferase
VTAALILAAGESRRMGSPKPLLPFRGTTFLDGLIAALSARCSSVIVVLGAASEQVRAGTRGCAQFVVNHDYLTGQTSSMLCGLRAVPPEAEGVIFTLVDHPAVEAATIDVLVSPPYPLIRIPRFRGERGHPIWISRELFPELLSVPLNGAARDVIRAHRAETQFVDVDDAGVVADIDDPQAYRQLVGAA